MLATLLLSFAVLASPLAPGSDDVPEVLPPGTHTAVELTVADGPLPLRLDCSEDVTFIAQCSGLELEARFFRPDGTFAGSVTDAGPLDQVTVHLPGGGIADLELVAHGADSGVVDVSVVAGFVALPEGLARQALRAERCLARAESRRGDPGLGRIHDLLNGSWSCLRVDWVDLADEASRELWDLLTERTSAAGGDVDPELRQLVYLTLDVRARVAEHRLDLAAAEALVEQLGEGRDDPLVEALWRVRKGSLAWGLGRRHEAEEHDRAFLALGAEPPGSVFEPGAWEELSLFVASRLSRVLRDRGEHEPALASWQAGVERARAAGLDEAIIARHGALATGQTTRVGLEHLQRELDGGGPVLTDTLFLLASAARRRGHMAAAEELLRRAERQAAEHGHVAEQARVLDVLASLARSRGDRVAARAWHERGLALVPDLDLRTDLGLSRALFEARLDVEAPLDVQRARFDAVLAEARALGDADLVIEVLEDLVELSLRQGRPADALAFAEQHVQVAPQGWRQVRVPVSWANLAEAYVANGQAEAADHAAARAQAALTDTSPWHVRVGVWHAATLGALGVDDPARAEQALTRGLDVLAEAPSDADPVRHALRRSQDLTANWLPLNVDVTVARARAAADEAERQRVLADGYARHGGLKARVLLEGMLGGRPRWTGARPAEVAARLAPDEVFVEYLVGREHLHALVLEGGRDAARLVDLGSRGRIEALVDAYVAGLAVDDPLMPWPDVAALGGDLGARLLAPVLAQCAVPPARLVVAPGGRLATLPFGALVLASADEVRGSDDVTFAADSMLITSAPSGSVFVALESRGGVSGGRLLAVADPLYESSGSDGGDGSVRATSLARLVASREEVLGIADLLTGADPADSPRAGLGRHGRVAGSSFELLLGDQATREALLESLSAASLVHLAAHGRVDAGDPRRTGLVLSGGELLTVPDILELELDADLAVLSACSTARGAVFAGEGVQSLAQAFLRAGARSVVASLWQVDDASTAALMQAFYARLFAGDPVPLAFGEARRELRGLPVRTNGLRRGDPLPGAVERIERERVVVADHPHRWAPFVVVGR